MKKALCFAILAALLTGCVPIALAQEESAFDYTVLEWLDGYSYDKFDSKWTYYQAYIEKYSDASILIGIQIEGTTTKVDYAPILYARITEPNGSDAMFNVSSIAFIVDEQKYTYASMLEGDLDSSVMLGKEGKKLAEAFENAKSVSVKLVFENKNIIIDLDMNQFNATLKALSTALLSNNLWDYVDYSIVDITEIMYPLVIE